jgi:hypothetical protein
MAALDDVGVGTDGHNSLQGRGDRRALAGLDDKATPGRDRSDAKAATRARPTIGRPINGRNCGSSTRTTSTRRLPGRQARGVSAIHS